MNKFKTRLATIAAFALGAPVMLFAEGSNTPIISQEMSEAASGAVNQLKTDLGSWVTTVLPYILGIVGAFLVFWLVKLAIRVVKSFVSSSK